MHSLKYGVQMRMVLRPGADLLRDEGEIKYLKSRAKLGIVDSGLLLRKNPDAGSRLAKISPEVEDDGSYHGTHVAGIAASEKYGFNPNLPMKMFPVASRGARAAAANLLNALESAVNDPDVQVINMSWSFADHPQIVGMVKRAIAKGKWVLYAAGNNNNVVDRRTNGQTHFAGEPAFFKVGSSSYFVAPSHFSSFGAGTTVFAPGSNIESLAGDYNPNLKNSKSLKVMSGTSMASPHLAGLLATFRNIVPAMSADTAQKLIRETAIMKGPSGQELPFLNAYLAVKTALAARNCLSEKTTNADDCAMSGIAAVTRNIKVPESPRSTNCDEWQAYYIDLRKAFFLSRGSAALAARIESALPKNKALAEHFLFAPVGDSTKGSLAELGETPKLYRDEMSSALNFYQGSLDFETNVKVRQQPTSGPVVGVPLAFLYKEPIDLLEASGKNFPDFLRLCFADVQESELSKPCANFLSNAPGNFKERTLGYLRKKKYFGFKSFQSDLSNN